MHLQLVADAGTAPNSAGTWRLVFGTATKFRPFQYIPVDEDFVINMAEGKLALESSIGPFSFHVKGPINGWDAATGVLSFQFTQVDILFAGNKVSSARVQQLESGQHSVLGSKPN